MKNSFGEMAESLRIAHDAGTEHERMQAHLYAITHRWRSRGDTARVWCTTRFG
jgi:hypothetical protein